MTLRNRFKMWLTAFSIAHRYLKWEQGRQDSFNGRKVDSFDPDYVQGFHFGQEQGDPVLRHHRNTPTFAPTNEQVRRRGARIEANLGMA